MALCDAEAGFAGSGVLEYGPYATEGSDAHLHLVIDGYGGDRDTLQNAEIVRDFLERHPGEIGMTKIAPPQVYTYTGQQAEDWGVSGFVLIAESHISVHTFPARGYINVDLFSCKFFDSTRSADVVRRTFGLNDVETCVLERGVEYVDSRQARSEVVAQRRILESSAGAGSADS